MNRLKFLLFALVTLGVVGYLVFVSPAAALRSSDLEMGTMAGAAPSVALRVEAQRSELQAAVVKLAASPAVWNVGPKAGVKPDAPSADRFNTIRSAVVEVLSEPNKARVVIAAVNEVGALVAQGPADPAGAPEGFELQPLIDAGAAGSMTVFGGAPFVFYATPLLIADKNEVRGAGTVLVGLPVLPDAKQLDALAKELKLTTLALVSKDKVLLAGGPDKQQAESAFKALKTGQSQPMLVGSVREFGPLSLPLFVTSPAHAMGTRQAIAGTPFEVVAMVSVREPLDALASFQLVGVGALLGLLLLSVVVTLLLGNTEDESGGMSMPAPLPLPPVSMKKPDPVAAPAPLAMADHAHAPEASPDDFHFPPSAPPSSVPSSLGTPAAPPMPVTQPLSAPPITSPQTPAYEPPEDPFAAAAPVAAPSMPRPVSNPGIAAVRPAVSPPSKPPPPINPFDDDESDRTAAYPTFRTGGSMPGPGVAGPMGQSSPPPVVDPFALATGELLPEELSQGSRPGFEDNPDATRVAAVPQELIKAARGGTGNTGEVPAAKVPAAAMPRVQSVAPVTGSSPSQATDAEDRHFQDVFRDFVATREKCGEAADGLTFEKFRTKLLKNKDQLVAKYQCRTVRFQVYVKEGKAALKATPVKD